MEWLIFPFQLVQLVLFLRLSNLPQLIAQKVMNSLQDQISQEELLIELKFWTSWIRSNNASMYDFLWSGYAIFSANINMHIISKHYFSLLNRNYAEDDSGFSRFLNVNWKIYSGAMGVMGNIKKSDYTQALYNVAASRLWWHNSKQEWRTNRSGIFISNGSDLNLFQAKPFI